MDTLLPRLGKGRFRRLAALDIHGMTCTEVRGFGRQHGHTEVYRAAVYQVDFVAKIRLEIVVHNSMTESVVQAVMEAARTGNVGDGKIFVTPVENAWRIRTGEEGDAAL